MDGHSFADDTGLERAAIHHPRCRCQQHSRRHFTATLIAAAALPGAALAQTIPECKRSTFTKMVSAQQVEQAATQQYRQMLQQAANQKALGPKDHPQVVRLRAIAQRIIPYTAECNPDAKSWQWEVNLLGSQELNAFCMPGGKIAFYYGILSKLQLDDDEVAAIMGHEISHALLEHARERMGKTTATQLGIGIGAALLGLGSTGRAVGDLGGQLLTLSFSREDESQADRLGMIMAAKAGYNPRAGVTLWKKMMAANKGRATAVPVDTPVQRDPHPRHRSVAAARGTDLRCGREAAAALRATRSQSGRKQRRRLSRGVP